MACKQEYIGQPCALSWGLAVGSNPFVHIPAAAEIEAVGRASLQTTGKPGLDNEGKQAGRWTSEEHEAFLYGIELHGRVWSSVAAQVQTRSSAQVVF